VTWLERDFGSLGREKSLASDRGFWHLIDYKGRTRIYQVIAPDRMNPASIRNN
jgi:hypothetical protein